MTHKHKPLTRPQRNALENEAVFRNANEKVSKGLEKLEKMATKSNLVGLTGDDLELYFLCECSDENCTERIKMKASRYKKLHKDRKQFIVKPGHQAAVIEKVEDKKPSYTLVKKIKMPSEASTTLEASSVNNS